MTTTPDFDPLFKLYDMLASGCAEASVEEIKLTSEQAILFIRNAYDAVEHLGRIQNARAKVESGLDTEVE